MSADLAAIERALADALCAADPRAALKAACADESLAAAVRSQLQQVDPDGFGLASLLVVRLRFERVLSGSSLAKAWFERDPSAFAVAFRGYHTTQAPRSLMPLQEGAAFDAWAASSDLFEPEDPPDPA